MARRRKRPSPVRCSWPTNSERVRGRIRSASGSFCAASCCAAFSNRSMAVGGTRDTTGAPVKTIALVAKKGKSEAAELARQIRDRYPELKFLPDAHLAEQLGERNTLPNDEVGKHAELCVVLGGDGTLI